MRAKGKVAVITGSTKGIGRGAAAVFAKEGAKVVVTGRTQDHGLAVAKEIEADGGEAIFVKSDLSIEADCESLISTTVQEFGRIDILINNASPMEFVGTGGENSIVEQTEQNLDYIFRVGVYGPIWCCKYAIPEMRKNGGGAIVMTSSVASVQGIPKTPSYSAAKGAINSLTRQIAVEFAADGIRCNGIIVGFVPVGEFGSMVKNFPVIGEMWDKATLTRRARAEDIANAMLFLSTEESAYISGALLPVDGGITAQSVLPDVDKVIGALNLE